MSRRFQVVGICLTILSLGSLPGAAQDSLIIVTKPVRGDVFRAGDDVRVEWEDPDGSSLVDVSLLRDSTPVGDPLCPGGCVAPDGVLVVALPTGLDPGSSYSFLVGDRGDEVSASGESGAFQIMARSMPVSGSSAADVGGEAIGRGGAGGTDAGIANETANEDTKSDGGGEGGGSGWGLVIGAVAGGLVVAALCVFSFVVISRRQQKGQGEGHGSVDVAGGVGDGGVGDGGVGDAGGSGGIGEEDSGMAGPGDSDVIVSSSRTNGRVSLSDLAEMGNLKPVHEETAEFVTENPMISAIANGVKFHSSGGVGSEFQGGSGNSGTRFHSTGGHGKLRGTGGGSLGAAKLPGGYGKPALRFHSSGYSGGGTRLVSSGGSTKFPSSVGGSSNDDGDSPTAGAGDGEDEEGGGMFADADVVAARAAAAALGAGKKARTPAKGSRGNSGDMPRWDMSWMKSPARGRQKKAVAPSTLATATTAAATGLDWPSPMAARTPAAKAEKIVKAEGGGDIGPEEVAAPAPVSTSADWLVSTWESFRGSQSGDALVAPAGGTSTRTNKLATELSEEKTEIDAAGSVLTGSVFGASCVLDKTNAEDSEGVVAAPSPLSVGLASAATRSGRAGATASTPPAGGQDAVSEPECELPTPALSSAGRAAAAWKRPDYSWLRSSSGSMEKEGPGSGRVSPSGDSAAAADSVPTAAAASAEKAPSPNEVEEPIPSAPRHAGELGQARESPASGSQQQQRVPPPLSFPPKAQGGIPLRRTLVTPRPGGGAGAGGGSGRMFNSPSPRGRRVSEVVGLFENLTPKEQPGASNIGFSTPVRSRSSLGASRLSPLQSRASPVPSTPVSRTESHSVPPMSPLAAAARSGGPVPTPFTPGTAKNDANGAPAPEAVAPGGGGWTTPVATPDRAPHGGGAVSVTGKADRAGNGTGSPTKANSVTEELSRVFGAESIGVADATPEVLSRAEIVTHCGVGGRGGWSTPVATPDRTRAASALDSGHGVTTPECTATPALPRPAGGAEDSPLDESHYVWRLESPAGVDGLPSPIGSGEVSMLAIGRKRGRVIPAILGAADTPIGIGAAGAPWPTPGTARTAGPPHGPSIGASAGDGGDSSGVGEGRSVWGARQTPFGASQVAAFVADAQAEAAAEARAAARHAAAAASTSGQAPTEEPAAEAREAVGAFPEAAIRAAPPSPTDVAASGLTLTSDMPATSPTTGDSTLSAAVVTPAAMDEGDQGQSEERNGKGGDSEGNKVAGVELPSSTVAVEVEINTPVTAAARAETKVYEAAAAAISAATAAAEAGPAAEESAAKAFKEAERAAANAANGEDLRVTKEPAEEVGQTTPAVKVGDALAAVAAAAAAATEGSAPPAEAAAAAETSKPAVSAESPTPHEGEKGQGMNELVNSLEANAWREVYNSAGVGDSEADTDSDVESDSDSDTDADADVGAREFSHAREGEGEGEGEGQREREGEGSNERAGATTGMAPESAAMDDRPGGSSEVSSAKQADANRAGALSEEEEAGGGREGRGEVRDAVSVGAGAADDKPEGGEGDGDPDSLLGEESRVDALVAGAMALADAAERDAGGDAGGDRGRQDSGDSSAVGVDAQREVDEVKALVAEALALVRQASEDAQGSV